MIFLITYNHNVLWYNDNLIGTNWFEINSTLRHNYQAVWVLHGLSFLSDHPSLAWVTGKVNPHPHDLLVIENCILDTLPCLIPFPLSLLFDYLFSIHRPLLSLKKSKKLLIHMEFTMDISSPIPTSDVYTFVASPKQRNTLHNTETHRRPSTTLLCDSDAERGNGRNIMLDDIAFMRHNTDDNVFYVE
jgi:hypothetical protein